MGRSEFTANNDLAATIQQASKMATLRAQYKAQQGQLCNERKPLNLNNELNKDGAPIADPNNPDTWMVF